MGTDPLELLTIPEVAARLHLSRGTVNRYVQSGLLPSVRVGRSRRVSRSQLGAFLEELERSGSVPAVWPRPRAQAQRVAASSLRSTNEAPDA